jgi:hypothetical protein
MQRVRQALASGVLLVYGLLGTGFAQAPGHFPDMSADMVSSGGGLQSQGKFYTSKGRIRVESSRGTIMIMDPAMATGWALNSQRKTAVDVSASMKAAQQSGNKMVGQMSPKEILVDPNNPCAALKGSSCKKLGNEMTNGRQTTKWEVRDSDGKPVYLWIDPKLWLAVKTQTENYTGEFRNIKEGPQPDSLFQVPADYKKVSRPGMPGTSPQ